MTIEVFCLVIISVVAVPLIMLLYYGYKERQSEINYYRERNRK